MWIPRVPMGVEPRGVPAEAVRSPAADRGSTMAVDARAATATTMVTDAPTVMELEEDAGTEHIPLLDPVAKEELLLLPRPLTNGTRANFQLCFEYIRIR